MASYIPGQVYNTLVDFKEKAEVECYLGEDFPPLKVLVHAAGPVNSVYAHPKEGQSLSTDIAITLEQTPPVFTTENYAVKTWPSWSGSFGNRFYVRLLSDASDRDLTDERLEGSVWYWTFYKGALYVFFSYSKTQDGKHVIYRLTEDGFKPEEGRNSKKRKRCKTFKDVLTFLRTNHHDVTRCNRSMNDVIEACL